MRAGRTDGGSGDMTIAWLKMRPPPKSERFPAKKGGWPTCWRYWLQVYDSKMFISMPPGAFCALLCTFSQPLLAPLRSGAERENAAGSFLRILPWQDVILRNGAEEATGPHGYGLTDRTDSRVLPFHAADRAPGWMKAAHIPAPAPCLRPLMQLAREPIHPRLPMRWTIRGTIGKTSSSREFSVPF